MDSLRQDLRLALRRLRARPTATLTILVVLALGIGATLVVAGVLDAVLLRPLDYPAAERLVHIQEQRRDGEREGLAFATLEDLRRLEASGLAEIGGFSFSSVNLTGSGDPRQLRVARVSNGFFATFGLLPELGRSLDPEENERRSQPVVVLSHALWQDKLGGRADVLGEVVDFDGSPHEVVGIMPARFSFPSWADAWVPLGDLGAQPRDQRPLNVVARLAPAGHLRATQSALDSLAANLAEAHPATFAGRSLIARPLLDLFVAGSRPMLIAVFCGVAGLLLIVCLNVASLGTAGALERVREISVRAALGARRGRMMRQLVTESLLLSTLGGIAGVLLAVWGLDAIKALGPATLPRLETAHVDGRLLGFAGLLITAVGVLSGLAPALRATRRDPAIGLEAGRGTTADSRTFSLRNLLVAGQVAITLALLVAAGLAGRSFSAMARTDTGFDVDRLLSIGFVLPPDRYPAPEQRSAWISDVLAATQAVPGVERASTINFVPFTSSSVSREVRGGIATSAAEPPLVASELVVSPGYFATVGLPLLAGRDFDRGDDGRGLLAVIVSRALAKAIWGEEEAVGQRLSIDGGETVTAATVVGLVADAHHAGVASAAPRQLYRAYAQQRWLYSNLIVRAQPQRDPASLIAAVQRAVWSVDPDRPLFAATTSQSYLELELAQPRFRSFLLVFFSGFGLLLAAVGIYSMLAVSVRQRRREIGIRLALGAARHKVRGLIVREGMVSTTLGLVLGVPLALAATRLLATQLVGVEPGDPWTFAAVAAILLGSAYAAIAVPAARASRVDPMTTLREE